MPEKTEAQKKAQKKYMEKFMVAQVRMEREKYGRIQAHAEAQGQSVNAYINAAIDEKMAQETVESRTRPVKVEMVMDTTKSRSGVAGPSTGRTEGNQEKEG